MFLKLNSHEQEHPLVCPALGASASSLWDSVTRPRPSTAFSPSFVGNAHSHGAGPDLCDSDVTPSVPPAFSAFAGVPVTLGRNESFGE